MYACYVSIFHAVSIFQNVKCCSPAIFGVSMEPTQVPSGRLLIKYSVAFEVQW